MNFHQLSTLDNKVADCVASSDDLKIERELFFLEYHWKWSAAGCLLISCIVISSSTQAATMLLVGSTTDKSEQLRNQYFHHAIFLVCQRNVQQRKEERKNYDKQKTTFSGFDYE
jgi:hypothetical protein